MTRPVEFLALCFAAIMAAPVACYAQSSSACESLASFKIEGGIVTAAHMVAAGEFAAPADPYGGQGNGGSIAAANAIYPTLPGFCRVEAILTPSSDSTIHIEVWMPTTGYNGKLVEAGNGAFAGALNFVPLAKLILQGYAATESDTGHTGNNGSFALGHPEKLIDFGYRAVHVDALAARAILNKFYGSGPSKAYFQGCSTGGRQAYGEAERYPDDFDGIIAGAPGINFTHQTAAELAIVKQVHDNPSSFIPAEKLQMLHASVIAACDAIDGVKDGVIENPLRCHFDPSTLLCHQGDAANCLTAPQVALAKEIYAGVKDSQGKLIFAGLPPGTELIWGNTLIRTEPMVYGVDAYRLVVMQDPKWNYTTLDLDRDIPEADQRVGRIVNNYDPNLSPFFGRGGKLLAYQGWADGMNSPLNHLQFYKSVAEAVNNPTEVASSYRFFLVPGMAHCGGGNGTDTFDTLAALDRWVSTGKAPDSIPASRVQDGKTDRTRPLCAYPSEAVYKGSGSTDDAANFTCAVR